MASVLGMLAMVPGSIAQRAADLPPVAWALFASAWAALLVIGALWAWRRRPSRVGGGGEGVVVETSVPDPERGPARMRGLVEALAAADEAPGGVLAWLVRETESTSAVYLELAPGGSERFLVAPRGLPNDAVVALAARAREELMVAPHRSDPDSTVIRWLGVGGSKCIVLAGASQPDEEPLRFARYMLEWLRSIATQAAPASESGVRDLPGVAWAEERGDELCILLDENADRHEVAARVHRMIAGSSLRLRWLEVPGPAEAPGPTPEVRAVAAEPSAASATALGPADARVKIVDLVTNANGRVTADVRVTWNEQELRGRGHGSPSEGGRHYASAAAVADALRPLLDSDIEIRGLYTAATQEQVPVLIVEVQLEGQSLVGAVLLREQELELAGARAVLDAVNRRLTQLAGRSGRI